MMLQWFNAREAADVGVALADEFAARAVAPAVPGRKAAHGKEMNALQELLRRADSEVRNLRLNFFKKAKFANTFKWRLIEKGIDRDVADEVTQSLVLHLSQNKADAAAESARGTGEAGDGDPLLALAQTAFAAADWTRAVELYDEVVSKHPGRAEALNTLGVALYNLGRYQEAEQRFREAIDVNPEYAEALCNLAGLLQGSPQEAEPLLRRVLKINPKFPGARSLLGLMLVSSGRDREAKTALRKALKISPKDANALVALSQIARAEGQFGEAESLLRLALKFRPKMPGAWAALQSTRKMSSADAEWYATAEQIVAGANFPLGGIRSVLRDGKVL